MEEEMTETKREFPIFRDIRRYTCAYCGIVRSKKTLITTHILQSHHQVSMYVFHFFNFTRIGNSCWQIGFK
ncbi:putative transcription factor C2H2 family [Helianthus anomalus]